MDECFLLKILGRIAKKTGLRSVQITIIREYGGQKHHIHSYFAPNPLWVGSDLVTLFSAISTILRVDNSKEDEKKLLKQHF
jgi:hypothetical protein